MKRTYATVALASLAALSVMGYGWQHWSARADGASATTTSTLTVMGHATQQVQPDEARIDAGIVTTAGTAASAQSQNDQKMKQIMNALKQAGVQNTDVKTLWYNIQPNLASPGRNEPPAVTGFTVNDTIEITVHDLTKVGLFIDSVVKSGANQVQNVSYQISNLPSVQEQAYNSALADAKAQAQNIAKSLGLTITGVQSVDTTGGQPGGPIMFGSASAATTDSTPVSPGSENISTDVRVVYTLGN